MSTVAPRQRLADDPAAGPLLVIVRARAAAVLLVLALALTAGCTINDANPPGQSPSSAEQSRSTPASASASGSPSGSESSTVGKAQTLNGTVGQEGDPDGFVITMEDSSGAEVTSLPAGEYRIRVVDLSRIHNFRLRGPGVDQATSVPQAESVTWTVRLSPGEYIFLCDPHPQQMMGSLTVT